jgi:hypothetical protein
MSENLDAEKDQDPIAEHDTKELTRETRSLQTQVYILAGVLLAFMVAVLLGAVLTTAVHMGVITAGACLHNLMDTAKEIVTLFLEAE